MFIHISTSSIASTPVHTQPPAYVFAMNAKSFQPLGVNFTTNAICDYGLDMLQLTPGQPTGAVSAQVSEDGTHLVVRLVNGMRIVKNATISLREGVKVTSAFATTISGWAPSHLRADEDVDESDHHGELEEDDEHSTRKMTKKKKRTQREKAYERGSLIVGLPENPDDGMAGANTPAQPRRFSPDPKRPLDINTPVHLPPFSYTIVEMDLIKS